MYIYMYFLKNNSFSENVIVTISISAPNHVRDAVRDIYSHQFH